MKFSFDVAVLALVPIPVACCAAPAFMAGLASSMLAWVAGLNGWEMAATAVAAMGLMVTIFHKSRI